MGDGVGLQEPGPINVPIVGPNRDLLFEVLTAASATQALGGVAGSGLLEQPADRGRAGIRSSLVRTDALKVPCFCS